MRPSYAWFARLWGVAVIAHLVAYPAAGEGVTRQAVSLLLAVGAVGLVVRPGDRRLLGAVAGLTLVHAFVEAPVIGNHWVLAALVSAAILVSLTRPDPWGWLAPTGRWMLLGFYSWAAFAKLNTGFFDPVTSCGLAYTNQLLGSWGLPLLPTGWGTAAAAGSALVELSVPVLLLVPRTRRWGVVLGMAFHTLISFDLDQHFYDFTSVLLPLFGLFLPDGTTGKIEERAERMRPAALVGVAAALAVVAGLATVPPLTPLSLRILDTAPFALWIPFASGVVAAVTHGVLHSSARAPDLRLAESGRVGAVVLVGIVVANGLTPYLELKTGYGWNMYANLVTAAGESNHLVIRRTLPLTDVNASAVEIVATDDPGLAAYVGSGWAVPERNLRHYLADRPEATVTFRRDGVDRTVSGAEIGERLPLWAEKLQLFRSVDLRRPPRCQLVWLPAW